MSTTIVLRFLRLLQGVLEQIILGSNVRCLNINTDISGVMLGAVHGVMDDRDVADYQYVFQLKLAEGVNLAGAADLKKPQPVIVPQKEKGASPATPIVRS